MSEGTFTIAGAGDAMVTKRLSTIEDERFGELRRLLTDADASIVNLEGPLHDFESYPVDRKALHFQSPPWAADELSWLGFDLFSATNNHIGDYAQPGMRATMEALDERELPYAGIGENLARARSPTYVDTSAGRVGVVAVTTTFVPGTNAAHQRRDIQGRLGISTLRLQPRYVVDEDQLEAIAELSDAMDMGELISDRSAYVDSAAAAVPFLDAGAGTAGELLKFEVGSENTIRFETHPDDVAELYEAIDIAQRNADKVVVSLHSHEGARGTYNDASVPVAIERFARNTVDRGADAFFSHGAHRMRGLELYSGTPIFYGLGNFILQFEAVPFFPSANYEDRELSPESSPLEIQESLGDIIEADHHKQSVVPVCRFNDDGLMDIQIYPVELGYSRDAVDMGAAYLAEGDLAFDIIDRLSSLSEPYGTDIQLVDGIGVVEP